MAGKQGSGARPTHRQSGHKATTSPVPDFQSRAPRSAAAGEAGSEQKISCPHTPACSPGAAGAGEPWSCARASAVGAQSPLEDSSPVRAGAGGERGAHPVLAGSEQFPSVPQGRPHVRHTAQTHRKSPSPGRDVSLSVSPPPPAPWPPACRLPGPTASSSPPPAP